MDKKNRNISFSQEVYQIVKKIPRGKVTTYRQIAGLIGNPKAAQAVGNALHKNPDPEKIPCYKVVDKYGFLAKNFGDGGVGKQAKKLQKEGIVIKLNRKSKMKVDLKKYLWRI